MHTNKTNISQPIYECCKNCSNNPFVNKYASGVCNCTLPYLEMKTY